jgi:hypothetical protein
LPVRGPFFFVLKVAKALVFAARLEKAGLNAEGDGDFHINFLFDCEFKAVALMLAMHVAGTDFKTALTFHLGLFGYGEGRYGKGYGYFKGLADVFFTCLLFMAAVFLSTFNLNGFIWHKAPPFI